jgi:NodT family efflux transporter outer membrane factor (OMF) lipoprotein
MRSLAVATTIACAAVAGCTFCPTPARNRPPVRVPKLFASGGGSDPATPRWWRDFNDPQLNALMQQALDDNLSLRRAWARLRQASMLARQARSPLWPSLDAEAAAARTRTEPVRDMPVRANSFSIGLVAAYELDLWGRIRSLKRAALHDAHASAADVHATAILVAANVTDTWYALVAQREQRQLLKQQVETNRQLLELVELRFSNGRASALDVYQQRQLFAITQGQIPAVEASQRAFEHLLATLLGRVPAPGVAPARAELPELPALPATGIPADLLLNRPDVRAAAERLAAADDRVAAAVADRLPALRLTGSLGLASPEFDDLAHSEAWSIAGSVLAPIFDAGRRRAEVSRQKAVVEERLADYAQVLLTALREVEDALVLEAKQKETLASIVKQEKLGQQTLNQAKLRFVNGQSEYLPVLTALQDLYAVQRRRITARQQLIAFRIQLHRALGGTWPRELAAPTADAEETR